MQTGSAHRAAWRTRAFTLIELLVVLAIMATLLTLVVPRYFQHTDRAAETVLKHNLVAIRDSIDKFRADNNRYPANLQELVTKRYLREIPMDPVAGTNSGWVIASPPDGTAGVYDVKSSAKDKDHDGKPFTEY